MLAGLLATGCSSRDETVKPPSKDAKGSDAKTDAPEPEDVDETPDPGTEPADTSDTPEVPVTDVAEPPATVAGVYQGAHDVTVTSAEASTQYTGKLGIKVRDDGVFSGTGLGSDTANTTFLSVTLSGQVQGKDVTGTLEWTWAGQGPEVPPPATLQIAGTVLGSTITAKLTGGNQQLTYQGTFSLEKTK